MLTNMYAYLVSRFRNEEGATLVEYGLLLALIAVVVMVVLGLLGLQVKAMFQQVCDFLNGGVACT